MEKKLTDKVAGQQYSADLVRGMSVLAFLVISAALWTGFAFDTYFASDGANYFVIILDNGRFTEIAPARMHAEYMSQWPLVLGVAAGMTNLPALEVLFGLGLWFPWILAFIVSLYATRERPELISFFLVSLASLNLAAWSVFIGEHLVLLSLAWPILYLGLLKRPMNWLEQILTLLLLVVHLRLYESAVVTGCVFALLFGVRMWLAETRRERWVSALFVVLALAAALIAFNWILFPRDADNRTSFLYSMLASLLHPYPWIGISFVGLMFVGVIFESEKCRQLAIVVPGVIFLSSLSVDEILAGIAFSTRTLSLSALPFLMVIAIVCHLVDYRFPKRLWAQVMGLVVLASLLHVRHLQGWIQFREHFRTTLKNNSGFVDPKEDGDLVHWGWTNTLLSYVWSDGKVDSIILNPDENGYQPFDPRTEVVLSKYVKVEPGLVSKSEVEQ